MNKATTRLGIYVARTGPQPVPGGKHAVPLCSDSPSSSMAVKPITTQVRRSSIRRIISASISGGAVASV